MYNRQFEVYDWQFEVYKANFKLSKLKNKNIYVALIRFRNLTKVEYKIFKLLSRNEVPYIYALHLTYWRKWRKKRTFVVLCAHTIWTLL